MNAKLTLRMDEDVIRGAKAYSAKAGKSVMSPEEMGALIGVTRDHVEVVSF